MNIDYKLNKDILQKFINLSETERQLLKDEIDAWPDWKKQRAEELYSIKI